MSLKDQILEDMKKAMKEKDKQALNTIRLLRSEIRNKEISEKEELDDDEVIGVVSSLIKKHKDALEQARDANRPEMVEENKERMEILQKYMPEQLSESEIEEIIDEVIEETGASSMRDMGVVMGTIMSRVKGKADGKLVNKKVRERLSS